MRLAESTETNWMYTTRIGPSSSSCKTPLDSGGPLVSQEDIFRPAYLEGVLSFSTLNCGTGEPIVYTKIHFYMPWILNTIKERK